MKKKLLIAIFAILIITGLVFCFCKMKPVEPENVVEEVIESNVDEITEQLAGAVEGEEFLEQGFVEFSDDIIAGSSRTAKDDGFNLGPKQESIVYFSQTDARWKNKIYSNHGDPSQTMGSSACGPTSAAMVVSGIKGLIYPDQMADLYVKYGYRSYSDGTYFSAFQFTADYFDMEFKRVWNVNDAIQAVRDNYYVVASCGNGLFTTGGHFIVMYGIDGDTIKVYDPYLYNGKFNYGNRGGKVTLSGNTALVSVYNFKNYANSGAWFCFKHNNGNTPAPTPVDPTPTPTPTDTKTGTVKVNSSLNVRRGPGTGYAYVRSLYNGNQVTIYETSNGWYRIGDREWVIDDYVTVKDNPTPTPSGSTVGQTRKLKGYTTLYSNSDLSGTEYSYLANTSIVIKENVNNVVDKIYVPATGRTAYVAVSAYKESGTSRPSTVGQYKYFKTTYTYIYTNSGLTGTPYTYLANTKVQVKQNVTDTVDYIYVPKTGRYGYVFTGVYK